MININKYNFIVGVPFSGLDKVIGDVSYISTVREDQAIAVAFGALMAGKKPLVFMQNSGLGLCIDIITSLLKPCKVEVPIILYNRYTPEHHFYMDKIIKKLIKLLNYKEIYVIDED